MQHLDKILGCLAFGLVAFGSYWGLAVAPPEVFMGDVYRIMYVHVPSAWLALIAYTVCFGACVTFLVRNQPGADAVAEASAEIGVVFNALLVVTGSIWGRPTWGVWWAWDPRLTTAAVMLFAYAGYLALRKFVDEPDRRSRWAAVAGILIYANIPIVWFSVKWWNSLHQVQSSPKTMGEGMVLALRINAIGFLLLYAWWLRLRYRLARVLQRTQELEPPEVSA